MNAILPSTEWTGPLELTDVFDYYDGPKLFVCRSADDQHFLGYWTGSDAVGDSYWIVPIGSMREESIRSGNTNLYDALTKPEAGFLYECRVPFANSSTEARRITPEDLNPLLLPDPEDYVAAASLTCSLPVPATSSLGDAA